MTRALLLLTLAPWASAQETPASAAPWMTGAGAQEPSPASPTPWAGAAAAQAPSAAPWITGGASLGAESTGTAKTELEAGWSWARLARDLEQVGRVRAGLEEELRELRRARGRLLVKDPRTGEMLLDHQAVVLAGWRRVADRLLALDSIVIRYGGFEEVVDAELRAGAFLAAYAAFSAQTRFARDWLFAAGDPAMAKIQDAALPDLGLRAGSFSSLREAVLANRDDALSDARAYSTSRGEAAGSEFRMPGARGLLKAGRSAALALAGLKADAKGGKAKRGAPARSAAVPVPRFDPWLRPVTAAGVWTGEGLEPRAAGEEKPAPIDWTSPTLASVSPFTQSWSTFLSTSAAAPVEEESTLHRLVRLLVERSTAARPVALLTPEQLKVFGERLQPGDILLMRREGHLEEPGLGGWWTGAGLYVGTPEERERITGSRDLDGEINSAAPDAYWLSLEREEGNARRAVIASPAGIQVRSLELGASGDSLAALRPRLPLAARARAAYRAFLAVGRPYDGAYAIGDDSALYSVELVLWAYAETPIKLEPRELARAGPPAPDDLVRTFDSEFGTARASLDVVRFLDGREQDLRAVPHEPEQLRLTWKRPRWRFETAPAEEPFRARATETAEQASERK